jgi:hypothetical protein
MLFIAGSMDPSREMLTMICHVHSVLERKIPVETGIEFLDTLDEEIGLEGMSRTGRWNGSQ